MSHCQTYVTVDSVEYTIAKVKTLGAQILLPPMNIERVVTVAAIKDP